MTKQYLSVDIGGTFIKYGIIKSTGIFVKKGILPTEAREKGASEIINKIKELVFRAGAECAGLDGIAVSTAGIVDPAAGSIVYAFPEIFPGYTGMPLKNILEKDCRIRCSVENDVNCAALGELWKGAGRNAQSVFCMTIGTSVGGCVILNGKVVRGASNSAGEIAFMRIPAGVFHKAASAAYLVRHTAEMKKIAAPELDGKRVFEMIRQGDKTALKGLGDFIKNLMDGILNICAVLNPEVIILGGGIMEQSDVLRGLIDSCARECLPEIFRSHLRISFARLGNDAGMIGALYHHLQSGDT